MLELTHRRPSGMWPRMFVVLLSGGALASFVATLRGTSPAQLNPLAPFGLCAGLNVFCGLAVATGSVAIAAAAYLIELPQWQQLRRSTLILATSGYTVAMLSMMSGLAFPGRMWPAVVQIWHPGSIARGAAWTMLLLLTVTGVEFLPARFSRLSTARWFLIVRRLQVSLVILLLTALILQQLGLSRAVTAESRTSPLWADPDLSVLFFVSSICAALALLLFAIWRSAVAFRRQLPATLMSHLGCVLSVAVFLYLALRLTSLLQRGLGPTMIVPSKDSALLLLEVGALVLGMMWVGGGESTPQRIQIGALMVIFGVMLNRLNTSITAFEATEGTYWPHWIEVLITSSLLALGVAAVAVCAKYLPVFVVGNENPFIGGGS